LERGEARNPSSRLLERLAKALQIDPGLLHTGWPPPSNDALASANEDRTIAALLSQMDPADAELLQQIAELLVLRRPGGRQTSRQPSEASEQERTGIELLREFLQKEMEIHGDISVGELFGWRPVADEPKPPISTDQEPPGKAAGLSLESVAPAGQPRSAHSHPARSKPREQRD
jgi:transcriptional regulator with XRE-family HTH domain